MPEPAIYLRPVIELLMVLWLVQYLQFVLGAGFFIVAYLGETVTLPCAGPTGEVSEEADVLWVFGGMPACWFQNGTWCESGDFIDRTQLGSIQQNNFSLIINDVRLEDQGEYKCQINNNVMQRFRLFVKGAWKRRAPENRHKDSTVCKPYEDKEASNENTPGAPSGGHLTVGLCVMAVIGVGLLAAVLIRRLKTNK